jgi:hypothetical protein
VDLVGHSGVLRERLLARRHLVLILAPELLRVRRLHRRHSRRSGTQLLLGNFATSDP